MKWLITTLGIVFALGAAPAFSQMSVTTFGATDGARCFQNANDEFSRDTEPCDRALANPATTRRDEMKTLVNRGIIHNRTGALQAAIDDFDDAIGIDQSVGEAWLNRGNSYFLAGDIDQALADYEAAIERDVNEPWAAWYNIGLALMRKNQNDKAREAFEKSLELNPDFSPSREKLAQIKSE
jgi:tetratricopeptide (TPR) repeat protein